MQKNSIVMKSNGETVVKNSNLYKVVISNMTYYFDLQNNVAIRVDDANNQETVTNFEGTLLKAFGGELILSQGSHTVSDVVMNVNHTSVELTKENGSYKIKYTTAIQYVQNNTYVTSNSNVELTVAKDMTISKLVVDYLDASSRSTKTFRI